MRFYPYGRKTDKTCLHQMPQGLVKIVVPAKGESMTAKYEHYAPLADEGFTVTTNEKSIGIALGVEPIKMQTSNFADHKDAVFSALEALSRLVEAVAAHERS